MKTLELNQMEVISGEGFWGDFTAGFCGGLATARAAMGAYALITSAAVPGAGWVLVGATAACGIAAIVNS